MLVIAALETLSANVNNSRTGLWNCAMGSINVLRYCTTVTELHHRLHVDFVVQSLYQVTRLVLLTVWVTQCLCYVDLTLFAKGDGAHFVRPANRGTTTVVVTIARTVIVRWSPETWRFRTSNFKLRSSKHMVVRKSVLF